MFWFSILVEVMDRNGDEWITVVFYILFGITSFIFFVDLVVWIVIFGLNGLLMKKIFLVEVLLQATIIWAI